MDQQSRRPGGGEAGFTLVEALIAVVILIFGLMAITNLFLLGTSSNSVANQSSAATSAAAETMERLKSATFSTLSAGGDLDNDVTGFVRYDEVKGVGRIRTRWEITSADAATLFLRVRSEGTGSLSGQRTRAEFTAFRVCTKASTEGCPDVSVAATP